MFVGIGVGIGRNRFAQGIFNAYNLRVVADGGITEAGNCVNAVSSLLQSASLLIIPSGYKGGKAYAEIPTNGNGDLTWTRASDAWRTNADGLIQRVPWNLLQYSEQFDNVIWEKNDITISANSTLSPTGTTTADKATPSTNNAIHYFLQDTRLTAGVSYTQSVYVKSNGYPYFQITGSIAFTTFYANFDLTNGTLGASDGGTATITNVGDGWFRLTYTLVCTTTTTAGRFVMAIIPASNSGRLATFAGNGTSGIYIWGAQLNEGSSAQTYFPTTDRLNVPRLSYMYGSCPALLLEPQRTNLALQSNAIGNATWAKIASASGTITATDNYNTSPDGNTNATRLVINNLGSAYASQSFTCVNGSSYTISIYAKSNTSSSYTFQLRDGYSGSVSGNLTITPTWQRFTFTFTASGTTAEIQFRTTVLGSYDLSVYGAQAELGAYATTLIQTTTASATRIADSFSRSNIYTNGLITSSGGTWFVELRGNLGYPRISAYPYLFIGSSANGSTGNVIGVGAAASGRPFLYYVQNGTFNLISTTSTNTAKIAFAWSSSVLKVYVNGSLTNTYTGLTWDITSFQNILGIGEIPLFLQQSALFTTPQSDQFCQDITTL
jgi:hypothetical protein